MGANMRKLLVLLTLAVGLSTAPAFAQMQGGSPSGAMPDIRNSDLGSHDSVNTPDLHDQLVQERQRELSEQLQEQNKNGGPARPAKASELVVGSAVNDKTGVAMAKIDQVDRDGIVVSTPTGKVKIPSDAFGHNKRGLLLDMTKAQFDQIVAKANAAS
jgi:hypothetical protein